MNKYIVIYILISNFNKSNIIQSNLKKKNPYNLGTNISNTHTQITNFCTKIRWSE